MSTISMTIFILGLWHRTVAGVKKGRFLSQEGKYYVHVGL